MLYHHILLLLVALVAGLFLARTALKFVIYMPNYILFWTENKIFEIIRSPVICSECEGPFAKKTDIFPVIGYFLEQKCPQCGKDRCTSLLLFEVAIYVLCVLSMPLLHYSIGQVIFAWLVISISICCFYIDATKALLPDLLTYSLLWVGLAGSLNSYYVTPREAILGVIIMHAALVNGNSLFKFVFKSDGICQGDIKYLSAITACFGFRACLFIVALAAILMLVTRMINRYFIDREQKVFSVQAPFAPYITVFTILTLYKGAFPIFDVNYVTALVAAAVRHLINLF